MMIAKILDMNIAMISRTIGAAQVVLGEKLLAEAEAILWRELRTGAAEREAKRVKPRTESPSMVAHDGSVELPGFVHEALGIKPGEFVYFVRDQKAGFRIMSASAMDAALGNE
jgi:hypothetical protein